MICSYAIARFPMATPDRLPPPPASARPEAAPIRWIFYTSGTTADPKGVLHTDLTIQAAARGADVRCQGSALESASSSPSPTSAASRA